MDYIDCFVFDKVSWSLGWPQTLYAVKDGLGLPILLPPHPRCCDYSGQVLGVGRSGKPILDVARSGQKIK